MKKCLFVVEGASTEKDEIPSFCKHILNLVDDTYEVTVFCTNIHALINEYDKNEYSSIVNYLADKEKLNLEPNTRPNEAYSLIYLIFDFDPQDPLFNEDKLSDFAATFVDETSVGKLYINYPMFEATIDISSFDNGSYLTSTVSLDGLLSDSYKKKVRANSCLRHARNKSFTYPIPDYYYPKIVCLNELKYRKLCGMKENDPWDVTDTPKLLDIELQTLHNLREIQIISSFVFLAKDY